MNTTYDLELEAVAKKLGFKKKWLSDHSGYWMEFKKDFKDLKVQFIIESDRNLFSMSVMSYNDNVRKLTKGQYETAKLFKCDIKTIKEVIKRYK